MYLIRLSLRNEFIQVAMYAVSADKVLAYVLPTMLHVDSMFLPVMDDVSVGETQQ